MLLCFFGKSLSQENANNKIHLAELPPEGILLDKGWKFQVGDNPDYAKTEYDDSKWQTINPTVDVHDSLIQLRKGIGWFRLHLSLDSDVLGKQFALVVQQSGASEIYLNGRLLHRFGLLSSDPQKVKA